MSVLSFEKYKIAHIKERFRDPTPEMMAELWVETGELRRLLNLKIEEVNWLRKIVCSRLVYGIDCIKNAPIIRDQDKLDEAIQNELNNHYGSHGS